MYNYKTEKDKIVTEERQRDFILIRDSALSLIEKGGAFMMFKPFKNISISCADTWGMMAMIDRMVELGDIKEVTPDGVAVQHRVFVAA